MPFADEEKTPESRGFFLIAERKRRDSRPSLVMRTCTTDQAKDEAKNRLEDTRTKGR